MTPGCGLRLPVSFRLELASFDVAGVLLNVGVPLLGKVILREDRRNWADWYASATVDALDRVNEELVNLFEPRAAVVVVCVLFRMDAVHRAGIHTGRILSPDTGFCDYVRHCAILLSRSNGPTYFLLVLDRSRSLLKHLSVPGSALACVARQLEVLGQLKRIHRTGILTEPTEHATQQVVGERRYLKGGAKL